MKILFTVAVCLFVFRFLEGDLVNRPVVHIYLEPLEGTELDSQAVYGSMVRRIENRGLWSKIATPDGSEGWVLSNQLTTDLEYEQSHHLRAVKNLFAHVYRVKDTQPHPPLLTLPYGAKVRLDVAVDTGERWVPIHLVGGEKAWIQRGDIDFAPKDKTLSEVVSLSRMFLGLPYTWGGTSAYGFDCSGFVQMLFSQMKINLPRNARDQASCNLLVDVSTEELQPGDLLFFGQNSITHVGLYLGDGRFIHSGVKGFPGVQISEIDGEQHFQKARRLQR